MDIAAWKAATIAMQTSRFLLLHQAESLELQQPRAAPWVLPERISQPERLQQHQTISNLEHIQNIYLI